MNKADFYQFDHMYVPIFDDSFICQNINVIAIFQTRISITATGGLNEKGLCLRKIGKFKFDTVPKKYLSHIKKFLGRLPV